MQSKIEDIGITIRSLVLSCKGGRSLDDINREYGETCGQSIPYKALGYTNLAGCIEKLLTRYVRIQRQNNGSFWLSAVESEETSHISKLVRGQKSSKRAKTPIPIRGRYPPRMSSGFASRGRPPFSTFSNRGGHPRLPFNNVNSNGGPRSGGGFSNVSRNDFLKQQPQSASTSVNNGPQCRSGAAVDSRSNSNDRFNGPTFSANHAASTFGQRQPVSQPRHRLPSSASPPPPPRFVDSMQVKRQLEEAAKKCGLEQPIYRVVPYNNNQYLCSVSVGAHKTGSLTHYPSAQEAECVAAQNALKLLERYFVDLRLDSRSNGNVLPNEDDFEKLVENILLLLEKYPCGLISHAVPKLYHSQFKSRLPDDWLKQLEENGHEISVEPTDPSRTRFIIAKKFVSSSKTDTDAPSTHAVNNVTDNVAPVLNPVQRTSTGDLPPPKTMKVSVSSSNSERKVNFNEEKNKVHEISTTDEDLEMRKSVPVHSANAQPLRVPEKECFRVVATTVESPSNFYIRIDESPYVDDFVDLHERMQKFYDNNEGDRIESANDFYPSRLFYAAYEEERWHRVAPVSVNAAEKVAHVYFLDHGDVIQVTFDNMRQLEPEFVSFPAQALKACLLGFEGWNDQCFPAEVLDKFQSLILDTTLLAERCFNDETDPSLPRTPNFICYNDSSILNLTLFVDVDENGSVASSSQDEQQQPPTTLCINEHIQLMIPLEKFESSPVPSVQPQYDEELARNVGRMMEEIRISHLTGSESMGNEKSSGFISPDTNLPTVSPHPIAVKCESQTSDDENNMEMESSPIVDTQSIPVDDFGDSIKRQRELFLDEDGCFVGCVTSAFDPSEFCVRPSSLCEQIKQLSETMMEFYASQPTKMTPVNIDVGQYYAVEEKKQSLIFRGYCSRSNNNTKTAVLYLLDTGEFYTCSFHQLWMLPRQFRILPSTIIQCDLDSVLRSSDVTKYYDTSASMAFSSKVFGRLHRFRLLSGGGGDPVLNGDGGDLSQLRRRVSLTGDDDGDGDTGAVTTATKPPIARASVQQMFDAVSDENVVQWLIKSGYAAPVGGPQEGGAT